MEIVGGRCPHLSGKAAHMNGALPNTLPKKQAEILYKKSVAYAKSLCYNNNDYNYSKGWFIMIVKDIIDILEGEIICEGDLNQEIKTACGSDMMSDVLAFVKDQSVLLTGLVNPQVVRTAEMMDMACIVFVRGKMPDESIINLAEQRGITLMKTRFRMFTACGKLYSAGLSGGTKV